MALGVHLQQEWERSWEGQAWGQVGGCGELRAKQEEDSLGRDVSLTQSPKELPSPGGLAGRGKPLATAVWSPP